MAFAIQNKSILEETPLRRDALALVEVGYTSLDTGNVLRKAVHLEGDTLTIAGHSHTLLPGKGVWVVGAGKCAIAGAAALEEILGERIAGGVVVDVADTTHCLPLQKITCLIGTHPRPTDVNVEAAQHIRDILEPLQEEDIVIALVSGGGSTLLCLPHNESLTCTREAEAFDELTDAGASIEEMNTVRKHISRARGGWLAQYAYPARLENLVFSDVPGNDLSVIASGPTVKDETTVDQAEEIIKKYSVKSLAGVALLETPKDDECFSRTRNTLLVTNDRALHAMEKAAQERGYTPSIVTDRYAGEAREIAARVHKELQDAPAGSVLLYGGESTVTLGEHPGKGGRNQELALAALSSIGEGEIIIPFASDGHDNTDHAGAVCDTITKAHAAAQGLSPDDYLRTHRSYDFFEKTGDALITGNTGTNVSDIIIALKARVR